MCVCHMCNPEGIGSEGIGSVDHHLLARFWKSAEISPGRDIVVAGAE